MQGPRGRNRLLLGGLLRSRSRLPKLAIASQLGIVAVARLGELYPSMQGEAAVSGRGEGNISESGSGIM